MADASRLRGPGRRATLGSSAMHALLVLVLALGACGGDGASDVGNRNVSPAGDTLPAVLVAPVERARDKIKRYCNDVGSPDIDQAVVTLLEIHSERPSALFESGDIYRRQTMRDVLAQEAQRLRSCGAQRAALRLESALE